MLRYEKRRDETGRYDTIRQGKTMTSQKPLLPVARRSALRERDTSTLVRLEG